MRLFKFYEFVETWNEVDVINGLKSKNRKYENMFYNKFYPLLTTKIKKSSSLGEDEIDMIVSDSIMRAINKIDQYDFSGSFEGWVRKICSNIMFDHIKSKKKDSNVYYKGSIPEKSIDLDYADTLKQMRSRYEMFKKHITSKQKKILDMYLNGYTHPEISKEMNISDGTSKWYINDIIAKFKKWLEKNKSI